MSEVEVEYVGERTRSDNVVRLRWEPGQTRELPEDGAHRLATSGLFKIVDNDDCSQSNMHAVYSSDGEPCPECGEDKWVIEVCEDCGEEDCVCDD